MSDEASKGWVRPFQGRVVSGVALLFASRFGAPVRLVRLAFLVMAFGGAALAVAAAIFDASLGVSGGLRWGLAGLGLALVGLYPALALFLPVEPRRTRWDFGSALAAVFALVLLGQAIGFLVTPYWDAAKARWIAEGNSGWLSWFGDYGREHGWGGKDLVFVLFVLSGATFVVLQRKAVRAFFRSMHVGVTLVTLSTTAVAVGVLVPQIDGFEDPDQRVDLAKEREDYRQFERFGWQKLPAEDQDGFEQYEAFRWAEGYFVYHMLHLYGVGMPEVDLMPEMKRGLETFAARYGLEEASNREKQMRASLSGQRKIDEIGAFIHEHEASLWSFFEVSTLLHLNRTYKSHWFAGLLFLLGIAIFFNTIKGGPRQWFTIHKLGFFTVHVGMLVLLAGGFVSKLFTDRGILHLFLGQPGSDTYWRHYRADQLSRMPFTVRLDEFARKDWMALEVHFPDAHMTSRPPRYTLWEGRTIDLDLDESKQPRLRLFVRELHDRTDVGLPTVQESQDPAAPLLPLAVLSVEEPAPADDGHGGGEHTHTTERYLPPLEEPHQTYRDEVYRDPRGRFRLAAAFGSRPTEVFPPTDDVGEVLGTLQVAVTGREGGGAREVPVRLGDTVEVPGYHLRVYDATADHRIERGDRYQSSHELPLEQQPYRFAAVWVEITPVDNGPVERRLVLEVVDAVQHGLQDGYLHSDVILKFAWDDWTAPGPPRYLLAWDESGAGSLIAQSGDRTPVDLETPLGLPGETRVLPHQLVRRAEFEKRMEFHDPVVHADGWDADFYSTAPRGLVLDVIRDPGTSRERTETVRMATTSYAQANQWHADDGGVALFFLENSEMLPFEWRSVLSILERDNSGRLYEVPLGSKSDREIRVNDYFQYKGYRFFQTNAMPEEPSYSGIGVVYDPGIPIVLFGMYTIIAGTVIAFLIRPVVLGVREGRGSPAAP